MNRAPQVARSPQKPLIADVQRVEFSFCGKSRAERIAQWRDRWIGEVGLPEPVRIRVKLSQGDARLWPELVVKPLIAVDVEWFDGPMRSRQQAAPGHHNDRTSVAGKRG